MKRNNLSKLPLSNLSFLILTEDIDKNIQLDAEQELKRKLKRTKVNYFDWLNADYQCFLKRGYDINRYLFGSNPNMQLLMELYFTECFDSVFDKNNLLFSERNLCNNMDFMSTFFDMICKLEMKNLETRMQNIELDKNQKEHLDLFYRALKTRVDDMMDLKQCCYNHLEILEFNEPIQLLESFHPNHEAFTKLDYLIDFRIMYLDSMRMRSQKEMLLFQAKNGYQVDYETDTMKKIYQKVKQNIGIHRIG